MIWIPLKDKAQIAILVDASYSGPVLLFKHSRQCFLSIIVKRKFKKKLQSLEKEINCYELDVIKQRSLSNLIAEKFAVRHQSPQLLVLEAGKLVEDLSHYNIISGFNPESLR